MLENGIQKRLNVRIGMERLHSYWRMAYIEAPKERKAAKGASPFAEMAKSKDFAKFHIVWKGRHSFIVMNKFPYNCGHLLVLPKREIDDLEKLSKAERAEFFDAVILAKSILAKAMNPDGFNVGLNLGSKAGAGIPQHLHCHVVPRWDGDTNFMPVISNTRVLPEAMDTLWGRLIEFVPKNRRKAPAGSGKVKKGV